MLFTCSPGLIENERSISAGGNHGKYKSVTWLNSTEPWVGHCCPTCSRPSSASASTPMYCQSFHLIRNPFLWFHDGTNPRMHYSIATHLKFYKNTPAMKCLYHLEPVSAFKSVEPDKRWPMILSTLLCRKIVHCTNLHCFIGDITVRMSTCWTRSTETISFSVSAKEVIKSLSSPMMGVEYDKPRPTWTKNKSHPNPTILIPPILRSSIHPSRSIPSRNLSALFLFGGMEGRKAF